MKYKPLTFFILLALISFSCSQPSGMDFKIRKDLESYFNTGIREAQIFGQVGFSNARLLELQKRMTNAINQNSAWFESYKKEFDLPLPYHPNFGLSAAEYTELLKLYETNKPELQKTGTEKIDVIRKKNKIEFKGKGKLKFLNRFTINLNDNTIDFNDQILKYVSAESSSDTNHIFKSAWSGYTYEYLEPENALEIPKKDYRKQDFSIYRVTVGRMDSGNRTLLIIKGLQYKKGKKVFDFEAPVLF